MSPRQRRVIGRWLAAIWAMGATQGWISQHFQRQGTSTAPASRTSARGLGDPRYSLEDSPVIQNGIMYWDVHVYLYAAAVDDRTHCGHGRKWECAGFGAGGPPGAVHP